MLLYVLLELLKTLITTIEALLGRLGAVDLRQKPKILTTSRGKWLHLRWDRTIATVSHNTTQLHHLILELLYD